MKRDKEVCYTGETDKTAHTGRKLRREMEDAHVSITSERAKASRENRILSARYSSMHQLSFHVSLEYPWLELHRGVCKRKPNASFSFDS